jgi:hypothetical protein
MYFYPLPKMKTTLLIFLFAFCLQTSLVVAQNLQRDVQGKWSIKKFQFDKKPEVQGGTLEFISDGTLLSEGVYFGTKKSSFRTDETRAVLLIENEEGVTEWLASIKNDVMRLKSTGNTSKPSTIYITLMKLKDK